MHRRKMVSYTVTLILFLLFLLSLYIGNRPMNKTKEIMLFQAITEKDYTNSDFNVVIRTSKQWDDNDYTEVGAQYDGVFYNNTKIDVSDWRIEVDVPSESRIDSAWNGIYKLEDGKLIITSVDYNEKLSGEESMTFGFVMYTKNSFEAHNITLHLSRLIRLCDYPLYWAFIIVLFILFITSIVYCFFELRFRGLKAKQRVYKAVIEQSLRTFANIIDAKDEYTKGHSERVAIYSREITKRMGGTEQEQENIYYMALLHDIGKIGIPDNILNKPGRLTKEEHNIIKTHSSIGGEILKDFTTIPGISDGACYHHERYDGNGYNEGLKGKEIPECARIIGIADAYDAMASARCYRPPLSEEYILQELKDCAGKQFDPMIVTYMITMIHERYAPLAQ